METKKQTKKEGVYFEAVGRRKQASARVRLYPGSKLDFVINERTLSHYFPVKELESVVSSPFKGSLSGDKFKVSVRVEGGGYRAQAEAIRLGIARALLRGNEEERVRLKKGGYLSRDARKVERKKFGLRKARRAPQWTKR